MRFLNRVLFLAATVAGVQGAHAQAGMIPPPVVSGTPQWTAAGPGLSDHGSRWMLRAVVEEDPDAAPFSLRIGNGWATPDASGASTSMWAAAGIILQREVTFHPWGWSETLIDEGGTPIAEGRVFTAGQDVFGLELRSLEATPREWWVAGNATPPSRLAVDGDALDVVTVEGSSHWSALFNLGAGARAVLFFAHGISAEDFDEVVAPLWAIEDWEEVLEARWEPWRALPGQVTATTEGRTEEALALLRHAHTSFGTSQLPVRAKGRIPRVELETMGLVARAYAQLGPDLGAATSERLLTAFRDAQDAQGKLPAWLSPSGETTTETRVPRFLTGWLSIAERLGDADRGRSLQVEALELEREVLDFWTQSRDRDDDAALECDGGREAGTPGSPRLGEVWSGDVDAPQGTLTDRLPLNCVEAGAWNHALAVEAARLAGLLGDDATALRTLATRRSLEVEDPVNGHWSPDQAGWFDYIRVGTDKSREALETRTHVLWAPLTTGLSREGTRIREVVDQLLDPEVFLREGVVSVSVDTRQAEDDPAEPWRGAIQPEVEWSALLALSRYGYEAQAQSLREQLLARAFTTATTPEGLPVGPADDVVAAAVHVLAAAHVDEEEVLLFEGGESQAKRRSGHFQRVFHPTDGRLLLEVVAPDPRLRPRITLTSETQLFSGEPMEVEISDPAGFLGEGTVQVLLPSLAAASGEVVRADGSREPFSAKREGETPIGWTAAPGDRLVLAELDVGQGTGCGCSGTGSASTAWGALLVFLLGWRGVVRRLVRD
ncbi:MAG TPA: hypothetical protein VK013_17895 [Myxococcaceae bacterium]|nr:hypothetical protein [Myxococcaceae bacterium]